MGGGCAQTYSVFPKLSHSLPICHYLWSPNYRVSDCVLLSHQCSPAPQSACLSTWPLAPPPLSRRRSRTPKPSSAPPPGQVTHRLSSGSSALCAKLKVATERCSPVHRTCCCCREITWIQSASPRARRKGARNPPRLGDRSGTWLSAYYQDRVKWASARWWVGPEHLGTRTTLLSALPRDIIGWRQGEPPSKTSWELGPGF